jgi:transposase
VGHRWKRGSRPPLRHGRWKKSDPCEPEDHALGRSRGGFSTKIHLLCDGQGHPLHVVVSPGQDHETTVVEEVLECASVPTADGQWDAHPVHLAGDKAYDAQWIRDYLLTEEITPVIPRRRSDSQHDETWDRERYRGRNVIERLVGRLKECRRVFSRFEKTAVNYLGMLKMGMILFYLRLFCPSDF